MRSSIFCFVVGIVVALAGCMAPNHPQPSPSPAPSPTQVHHDRLTKAQSLALAGLPSSVKFVNRLTARLREGQAGWTVTWIAEQRSASKVGLANWPLHRRGPQGSRQMLVARVHDQLQAIVFLPQCDNQPVPRVTFSQFGPHYRLHPAHYSQVMSGNCPYYSK